MTWQEGIFEFFKTMFFSILEHWYILAAVAIICIILKLIFGKKK